VVADDVADVLAEEALDALVELLPALDVLLHHPVLAVRIRRLEPERRHCWLLVVVETSVTRSRMIGTSGSAPPRSARPP